MITEGKKTVWSQYQKNIANDHYFYIRSCIRQNLFPGSETAFMRIMRDELGKDIFEDANHTTCTGIGYHTDVVPIETTMTVVARLFALMTERGYENMITSCITSFGVLLKYWIPGKSFRKPRTKTREYLVRRLQAGTLLIQKIWPMPAISFINSGKRSVKRV